MEGLVKSARHLGHIQISGMLRRSEPESSVFDYTSIFQIHIHLKYGAWIGIEYYLLGKTLGEPGWRKGWFT